MMCLCGFEDYVPKDTTSADAASKEDMGRSNPMHHANGTCGTCGKPIPSGTGRCGMCYNVEKNLIEYLQRGGQAARNHVLLCLATAAPTTLDDREEQRLDFAYGNLAASTNRLPHWTVFRDLAFSRGWESERFERWAQGRAWATGTAPAEPDANCVTTPDGGCVGGPCMHDKEKDSPG